MAYNIDKEAGAAVYEVRQERSDAAAARQVRAYLDFAHAAGRGEAWEKICSKCESNYPVGTSLKKRQCLLSYSPPNYDTCPLLQDRLVAGEKE